jgi:ATP-dependent DNA helicase DinG
MKRYFGPDGLLAEKLPGFEYRALQMQMAEAVEASLRDAASLLVEAATGTGKTWAYLIPAILSGKRIAVSTGTKTLQDQIFDHDIPVLQRLLFPQLRAVVLKGRKNYVCQRRLSLFARQPSFAAREEAKLYERLLHWAARTETGDRAEIPWLPDQFQAWNDLSSSSDQCLGQECPDYSRCFLARLRQQAARAHLLLVNHHLLFADLAVRRGGFGEVIPRYEAVIFDEAHQLEDIAASYFGIQWSNFRLQELLHDTRAEIQRAIKDTQALGNLSGACEHLDALNRRLVHQLCRPPAVTGRFRLEPEKMGKGFAETSTEMGRGLETLNGLLGPYRESHPALEGCQRRGLELQSILRELLEQRDPSLIYWYESSSRSVFLHGTPIEVAPIFQQHLFKHTPSAIFTSATLAAAGSFAFLRDRLGLPADTRELLLPSPFAYDQQALLYIPSPFPQPNSGDFCQRVADEAQAILSKTRGRALFLFTSYRNMTLVHELLEQRLPYPILLQGQKPKRILLAEFKENIASVLFATSSFWEGVDVPGEALSCVLIDKLPFEVPDDPLLAARLEALRTQGKNPFNDYQVPRAILHLKQGVGRLIRSSQDRGIIVLFDVRLLQKNYGRLFLESLPPCRRVHRLADLDAFAQTLR